MFYRRIRRDRRREERRYWSLLGRSWPRRMLMAAFMAAVLAAGTAAVSAARIEAVLGASAKPGGPHAAGKAAEFQAAGNPEGLQAAGNAEGLTEACTAPAGRRTASAKSCPPATSPRLPAANVSCKIIVPAHPLSAAGLATPYQLTGPRGTTAGASGCTMANAASLGAFVQATILDPVTGKLSVYEPLVITKGTRPAVAPVRPRLPKGAVVTIDFGFNGAKLTQLGATPRALAQGHCLDGLRGSAFGQVSFCHGVHFFSAARKAEGEGKLAVPRAGVSPKTRKACPTTRSFAIVDQDPSDNVTTEYLLTAGGRTAQFNKRNVTALPHATVIGNGSDNALLDTFVDPALGCTPLTAPDLSRGGTPGTSQALDELSAARSQPAPAALVPENDPMVLVHNALSIPKTDRYRSMIGQPGISRRTNTADSPAAFCQNMITVQTRFLAGNEALLASAPSPVPSIGDNLFTFMASRLIMSYASLNCRRFGVANPVKVNLDSNGIATSATFGTGQRPASR